MAKKYIDLDILDGWEIELSRTTERGYESMTTTVKELAEVLPVADVVEVRHGRWIKHKDRTCWYCSECVTDDYYAYSFNCDTDVYELQDKYCPNCGAQMMETKNDNT